MIHNKITKPTLFGLGHTTTKRDQTGVMRVMNTMVILVQRARVLLPRTPDVVDEAIKCKSEVDQRASA